MTFFEKVKAWWEKVGWTDIVYLAIAIAALIYGFTHVAAASSAIFIYINFNRLIKIGEDLIKK